MKNWIGFIISGVVGGAIVLFGIKSLDRSVGLETSSYAQAANHVNVPASKNVFNNLDFTQAAERAMPSVVHISANESKQNAFQRGQNNNPFRFFFGDDFFGSPFGQGLPRKGTGSGVIYTQDGYIVTNNHVIAFADEVFVTTNDNRKYTAEVVGKDPKTDLAVLKIDAYDLPILDFADSDAAKVGEWVLAVGNPFDLNSTVTAGIVSAKGRDIDIIKDQNAIEAFIQTDAAVNPGNSGGALVDDQGRLLGINTAIATKTGSFVGYSFAIPVNMMKGIVEDIIKYGEYKRVSLGVFIQELDSELADEMGLDFSQGVVISELVDGGSAEFSGLLPMDVIQEVNGNKIKSFPELQEQIGRARVGDVLEMRVFRKGSSKLVPVRLREE